MTFTHISETPITWNPRVRLVLSDVDETIADLYVPASDAMIAELDRVAADGVSVFFITGQSRNSVQWRIIDRLQPRSRSRMLIASCSGAEIHGFNGDGSPMEKPIYSQYDVMMDEGQKEQWRDIVSRIIDEFKLEPHATMPLEKFREEYGNNPYAIMMEDRGPQITFEVVNAYDLTEEQANAMHVPMHETHKVYDLRHQILTRAEELLSGTGIPVTPRLGGVFAVDFALRGISKTSSIRHVLENAPVLSKLGLTDADLKPEAMEIWGDKFSLTGGTDRHMSEAVDPAVRSIDFRQEKPDELPDTYNIVLWNGKHHLHDGTLEYLSSR